MRRPRKRPIYYHASRLYDGTVIAVFPERKPLRKQLKFYHAKIEEDGVFGWDLRSGSELRDCNYEGRIRFQDIIANSLNARRAVRELALPAIQALSQEVAELRAQLTRIEGLLKEQGEASS